MGSGARWTGFSIVDDRLCFGRRRPFGRATFRFEPDALVVVVKPVEIRLAWDEGLLVPPVHHEPGWWLTGEPGSRYSVPSASAHRSGARVSTREWANDESWRVGARLPDLLFAWQEAPALGEYLMATPHARMSVANPARLSRLLAALADSSWRHRGPPHEPMMGNALDLYLATQRVLAVAWPRRFGGRPVGGEPRPRIDDLIGAIENDLPSWVRREVDEDQIRKCLAREFEVGGWPFAMLNER